jgi:hypothetical protein
MTKRRLEHQGQLPARFILRLLSHRTGCALSCPELVALGITWLCSKWLWTNVEAACLDDL